MKLRSLFLALISTCTLVGAAFAGGIPDPPPPPDPPAYQAPASIRNTMYVAPGAGGAGTSATAPMSLAAACLAAGKGDIVYVLPGDYTTETFYPDSSGTSDNEIQYLGDVNHPESVIMPALTTSRSYLTIKYMSFQGPVTLTRGREGVTADSAKVASHVWVSKGMATGINFYGAQNCRVDNMVINSAGGTAISFSGGLSGVESAALDASAPRQSAAQYDTLQDCTITVGVLARASGYAFVSKAFANHNFIHRNRVTTTLRWGKDVVIQRALFNSRTNTFSDNMWESNFPVAQTDGVGYEGTGPACAFSLADSSISNTFTRDSIVAGQAQGNGAPGIFVDLISLGNSSYRGRCTGNNWTFCYIKTNAENKISIASNSAKNYLTQSRIETTVGAPSITFYGCPSVDTTSVKFKNWYIQGNTFLTTGRESTNFNFTGSCSVSAVPDTSFISDSNIFVGDTDHSLWGGKSTLQSVSLYGLEEHSLSSAR